MKWRIGYYSAKLEKEVLKLPDSLLARYIHLTDLMLEFGSNLGMPHTKAIDDGLFELRVKGKEGIARVFYCTRIGKRIVMLHVFVKKTQKTPKKELKLAIQRMKEVLSDES
ncbi:MAG: type II toxin-antitoxin system RelE/ParE family toxin [Gammaproteobacteria bacterium]|nr:type II toxin-antitoxin system RelE/ParE family toxin [Gammaproteobacteria bacterium]